MEWHLQPRPNQKCGFIFNNFQSDVAVAMWYPYAVFLITFKCISLQEKWMFRKIISWAKTVWLNWMQPHFISCDAHTSGRQRFCGLSHFYLNKYTYDWRVVLFLVTFKYISLTVKVAWRLAYTSLLHLRDAMADGINICMEIRKLFLITFECVSLAIKVPFTKTALCWKMKPGNA